MLQVLPLILWSGTSIAIFSSLFVPMISNTMNQDWSDSKMNSQALLAMISLGIGEIIGALISGGIQDKQGNRAIILYSLVMTGIAFTVLIIYN